MDAPQAEHNQMEPHQDCSEMSESNSSEESESGDQELRKDTLRIKLKIARMERDSGAKTSAQEDLSVAQLRSCEYCGKQFNNGKALGGHIRIHTQDKIQGSSLKKKEKSLKQKIHEPKHVRYANEDVSAPGKRKDLHFSEKADEKPNCCICDRHFPSMKSLFGHMRFHPERNWRGVQPPTMEKDGSCSRAVQSEDIRAENQDQSSPVSGSFGSVTDLSRYLPNWSTTQKRGRKSLHELEPEAAHGLIKLACAASYDSGLSNNDDDAETPPKTHRVNQKHLTMPTNEILDARENRIIRAPIISDETLSELAGADRHGESTIGEPTSSDSELIRNILAQKKRKMVEKKKAQGLSFNRVAPVPIAEEKISKHPLHRFKCMTCSKAFPTFQALGGHRSSHNKEKGTSQPPEATSSNSSSGAEMKFTINPQDQAAELKVCEKRVQSGDLVTHQCEICCKKFPTGQALGGHKRCHRIGPADGPPSSEVVSPGDQASQSGPKVLGFDLNELPAMDDEEGVMSRFNHV